MPDEGSPGDRGSHHRRPPFEPHLLGPLGLEGAALFPTRGAWDAEGIGVWPRAEGAALSVPTVAARREACPLREDAGQPRGNPGDLAGGSGWESNPPGTLAQSPPDGFEDRGAHRDSATPLGKYPTKRPARGKVAPPGALPRPPEGPCTPLRALHPFAAPVLSMLYGCCKRALTQKAPPGLHLGGARATIPLARRPLRLAQPLGRPSRRQGRFVYPHALYTQVTEKSSPVSVTFCLKTSHGHTGVAGGASVVRHARWRGVGGLGSASRASVERIIADPRELEVQKVAPCHCTGTSATRWLAEAFGDGFVACGIGLQVALGDGAEEGSRGT